MCQRIFDCLDDGAVQFGILPMHFQLNFLTTAQSEVANRTGKLVPNIADRLHARLHHLLLHFGDNQVHSLRDGLEGNVLQRIGSL